MDRFSRRHGIQTPDAEITVRHDAPESLRNSLVDITYESGLGPRGLRSTICRLLRIPEDPNNWSEFPNVDGEARDNLRTCEWYEVYDIIEAVHARLLRLDAKEPWERPVSRHEYFEQEINRYFRRAGIGWQLQDGEIQVRGAESFEHSIREARNDLRQRGRATAENEVHEALLDLSKRPNPDLTGALQHGLAALECVARDVTGDSKATLGTILAKHKRLLPPPMDQAAEKLWGFASEQGRHVREGREPPQEEVELAVHVAAALASYLVKKRRDG